MGDLLIKICGVTRAADALACAELGVDLMGLNFHPPSPRCLAPEAARAIADAVRGRVRLVGVFVNHQAEEVRAIDRAVGLDLLQFHGDEPAEWVEEFGARALKVFRVDPDSVVSPLALFDHPSAWGFLFDVRRPEVYGGSGVSWPYERMAGIAVERPILVAGGIGPANVRQALAASGADGVDVCSGVESAPGIKDGGAIARLVGEVRGG
jgi:phosphoribosylanthranilate isomerase